MDWWLCQKKAVAIEWRHGTIQETITCGIRLQVSRRMVSEVSVSGIVGRESEVCGDECKDVVWMERIRSGGVECSKGSCACDIGDSAEVFSVGSAGDVEGKDGDQDVSNFSWDEEETILGESFLGERVLCEHDRVGWREDQEICAIPGRTGTAGRISTAGIRLLAEKTGHRLWRW